MVDAKNINGILGNLFDLLDSIKSEIWKVIKFPFELWASLPSWVHWIAYANMIVIAVIILILFVKYRNHWRDYYSI